MQDKLIQYRELVKTDAEREALKKKLKARAEALEKKVLARYAKLDSELSKLREEIREELGEAERVDLDEATVELVLRRTVTVDKPYALAEWLKTAGAGDLVKEPAFDKRKLNTLVLTMDQIGQSAPGVKIEEVKDLRITLND